MSQFPQNPNQSNPNPFATQLAPSTPAAPANNVPTGQLKTTRGLLKFILLTIVTLGIYPIVFFSSISSDINLIASRYDGRRTMHYCLLLFLVAPLTLGIATFVWYHKLSARIGNEMSRRGMQPSISAGSFWGWYVFGLFILVGPFVYIYKLANAMNYLASDYNRRG